MGRNVVAFFNSIIIANFSFLLDAIVIAAVRTTVEAAKAIAWAIHISLAGAPAF